MSEKVTNAGQEATPDTSSEVAEAVVQTNLATDQVASELAGSSLSEPLPDTEVTTSSTPEPIVPEPSNPNASETTTETTGEHTDYAETKTEAYLDQIALKTEAERAAESAAKSVPAVEPEDVVFLPEEEPEPMAESAPASTEGHLEELTEEILEPEPSEPHPEKIRSEERRVGKEC